MPSTIFNRGSLPTLEALMHFTTARHRAIANNVANAETPGYRPIDVAEGDFMTALRRAYADRDASRTGTHALKDHGGVRTTDIGLDLRYLERTGTEKVVDLDMEMARMVKNAERHNLAATLLAQQMSQLREAFAGRILP